jgi:hypothetical protein
VFRTHSPGYSIGQHGRQQLMIEGSGGWKLDLEVLEWLHSEKALF